MNDCLRKGKREKLDDPAVGSPFAALNIPKSERRGWERRRESGRTMDEKRR